MARDCLQGGGSQCFFRRTFQKKAHEAFVGEGLNLRLCIPLTSQFPGSSNHFVVITEGKTSSSKKVPFSVPYSMQLWFGQLKIAMNEDIWNF